MEESIPEPMNLNLKIGECPYCHQNLTNGHSCTWIKMFSGKMVVSKQTIDRYGIDTLIKLSGDPECEIHMFYTGTMYI